MKIVYLFFLTLLSVQNCANKMQESFPIAMTEVYHQHWVAGVRGGGSGTGFYITFEKELPSDIQLNQLYFRKGVAKMNKISETQYMFSFVGKANRERGNEIITDDALPKETEIEAPFKIEDNEAVLEYTQKGEKKYFKITNVKEKEMLAYPSARPRN
ncbi:MAG: hypothetical protein V4670_07450 [Bacteroidota bacterium]